MIAGMITRASVDAGTAPIPADPPIGGPLWTIVLPAILLGVSFYATYRLYRHFSDR